MVKKNEEIDFKKLHQWCRGDQKKFLQYLDHFDELVSERLVLLNEAVENKNRDAIRMILHKMRPQIQFFGLDFVKNQMEEVELIVQEMEWSLLFSKLIEIREALTKNLEKVQSQKGLLLEKTS